MKIGELAELAGTTPRAVRHYHAEGLLPEPRRQPNGYRSYGVRELITLVKIKKLRDAGLSLAEVRDVITAPPGSGAWRSAMIIAERRVADEERRLRRLRRELRRQLETELDPTLPAPLAKIFQELRDSGLPPAALAFEQELILLSITYEPAAAEPLTAYYRSMIDRPGWAEDFARSHADFLTLADADPDDPRVAEFARRTADDALDHGTDLLLGGDGEPVDLDDPQLADFFDQFSPAQHRALVLAVGWIAEQAGRGVSVPHATGEAGETSDDR